MIESKPTLRTAHAEKAVRGLSDGIRHRYQSPGAGDRLQGRPTRPIDFVFVFHGVASARGGVELEREVRAGQSDVRQCNRRPPGAIDENAAGTSRCEVIRVSGGQLGVGMQSIRNCRSFNNQTTEPRVLMENYLAAVS